jgi:CrcB protein
MDALYVAAGGFIGAILRYLLSITFAITNFPTVTFFINLSGSFVIGFILVIAMEKSSISPNFRFFFATGLLGAFTTFSTYTLETLKLLNAGYILTGLNYYLWSVILGIIFAGVGAQVARQLSFMIESNKSSLRDEE